MKFVRWWLCCLLCVALSFAVSCGRRSLSVVEILLRLEETAGELPAGERYYSGVEEGYEGDLPSDLRNALYGEDSEEIFETVEEYAMYLSSAAKPAQIAVFRCYSATDAHRVTLMCMERVELLRVALRGTDWEAFVDGAVVLCRGRDVLLCLTDCAQSMEKQAVRLLR